MQNAQHKTAVTDAATLHLASGLASRHARCDYALFLGAGPDNAAEAAALAPHRGLKLYLDSDLRSAAAG